MKQKHHRALVTIVLFVCTMAMSIVTVAGSRPNVILILADDMAVGDLSCLNGGRSRTPNLDRLKDESLWFTQAYSASPVCAPARAALLTGRYPHRTGAVTLNMEKYPKLCRIRRDETTMADVFRANGYVTGIVGKWHSGIGEDYHPLSRGFDEFQGFIGHLYVPGYFRYRLDIQRETRSFSGRYLTRDLSVRAVDFVRRHRNEPFFLHLAHYAPHRPLDAPESDVNRYREKGFDEKTAKVYAMIEIMDEGIGELLAELDRLDLRDNTIVIFASDNGPDPLVGERFNSQLRGTKYTVHEGGIRVPFMLRWPGRIRMGQCGEVVHFTDVFPTLAELCNLTAPTSLKLDGASFVPAINGKAHRLPHQRFWQWNRHEPKYSHNAAVREGNWKLVRPPVTQGIPKGESTLPPALYDLASDPGETNDISRKLPGRVASMSAALDTWCKDMERDRVRPLGKLTLKDPHPLCNLYHVMSTLTKPRQITKTPHGHILTNVNVWSPDSRWIVYDIRKVGSVFDGTRIERVNVDTGDVLVLYESTNGACCGVVTYSPTDDRVVFIHGPENPTPEWSYAAHHRRGVVVDIPHPGRAVNLDARDLDPPFTPGALRGGTHVHVFSGDGRWVSSTYEDHVLAALDSGDVHELNQRNIAVSVRGRAVRVAGDHERNHGGETFTVLVSRTVDSPEPGSDEISRAFSDAWIGTNGYLRADGSRQPKAIAFQGHVRTEKGETISEVFIVDLSDDLTQPSDGQLEGTAPIDRTSDTISIPLTIARPLRAVNEIVRCPS